ncbi:MAG: hypothetical protein WC760_06660 [Bacteroidia bacterium]|jgi:hypothetical protein
MDILVLIVVALIVVIGISLFSILPMLTYTLYRHLRKKGNVSKNIGLALFLVTTLGMIVIGLKVIFGPSGFGPEYDSVLIDQKIGGKLLCYSEYNADIQSWQYDINYKYIDLIGDTFDFKSGSYHGRGWEKDERVLRFGKFLILKTGAWYGSDRLIIKNILTDSTRIFDIDNKFIEKDSLWKAQCIKSLINNCCAETFIQSIIGNEIILKYKFRTNKRFTNKYDERMVTFLIDKETGDIKMTKIN